MNKALSDALSRTGSWPEEAQEDLAQLVSEIDAELRSGNYHPTVAELAGIDRGLRDAEASRVARDAELAAVLRHRKSG